MFQELINNNSICHQQCSKNVSLLKKNKKNQAILRVIRAIAYFERITFNKAIDFNLSVLSKAKKRIKMCTVFPFTAHQ